MGNVSTQRERLYVYLLFTQLKAIERGGYTLHETRIIKYKKKLAVTYFNTYLNNIVSENYLKNHDCNFFITAINQSDNSFYAMSNKLITCFL